jgi:hypothetical protein
MMSNANEENKLNSAAELSWDKTNADELPESQALEQNDHGRQRARLIRECHAVAREDAKREGESFFGIQVIE